MIVNKTAQDVAGAETTTINPRITATVKAAKKEVKVMVAMNASRNALKGPFIGYPTTIGLGSSITTVFCLS